MQAHTPLIATIVAGLGLAFIFGAIANRVRVPPLVGYLLAGVVIGPFTPGFVADQSLAKQLAEIGVILLLFGVGLHFSVTDLLAVRNTAVPGAVGQIVFVAALGFALAQLLGMSVGAGLVFGLALSVASTVVVLRALQERRLISSQRGRIAVGWLVVQDLVMVLALVLLPPLAGLLGRPRRGAPTQRRTSRMARSADDLGCTCHHLDQARSIPPSDARRWAPGNPLGLALRRAFGLPRALQAVCPRDCAWGGIWIGGALRRVVRARSLLCRDDPGGVAAEPAGSSGDIAPAGCLCGALFRLGRNVVRPDHPGAGTIVGSCHLHHCRGWQFSCDVRDSVGVRLLASGRRDARREPFADRRVLVHSHQLGA